MVKRPFGRVPTRPQRSKKSLDAQRELEEFLSLWLQISSRVLSDAGLGDLKQLLAADQHYLQKELAVRGFDWESKEGYAAQINRLVGFVGAFTGPVKTVLAIRLGQLIAQAMMHKDWERGILQRERLADATSIVWGPPSERAANKARLRLLYQERRPQCASNEAAYKAIAHLEGISTHTVRRAVKGH